ncbi:MAG: hypothetical protein ACREUF_17150, partial [Solimonas sp.]
DTQADRYDLSKHIEELRVFKRDNGAYDLSAATTGDRRLHDIGTAVPESKLDEHVGKDLAERIVKGEGTPDSAAGGWRSFTGVALKVGGAGMRAFYDREVVNEVNHYVKKWGGKVSRAQLPAKDASNRLAGAVPDRTKRDAGPKSVEVHALDLTEPMRAAALQPQPMFAARPGDVVRLAATLKQRLRDATGSDLARRAAAAFLHKPLMNVESGTVATVSNAALSKMLSLPVVQNSASPQAHMTAVANLDHLFQLAVKRLSRPGKRESDSESVTAIHHFDAPMPFGGEVLRVKIMAKEYSGAGQGTRLYLVQAVEIDAGVVGRDPSVSGQFRHGGDATTSQPPPGANERFAQLVDAVKRGPISGETDSAGRPMFSTRSDTETAATLANQLTEAQRAAMEKIGATPAPAPFSERFDRAGLKLAQGLVDQFAPLKHLDITAYMQARLSKGTDGALEATFLHGTPKLTDGALDIESDGSGLRGILAGLSGEHDMFLAWIAGNRAAKLKGEGRENLFSDEDIAALKNLNRGRMRDGRSRGMAYAT